ncbi:MAG: Ger(x)C family spore germination C-terminal domain-containing protein [Clostridiaceae bacterium]|jgi:spore germination protein KC|nr:Ger(x)C family spore germination C-terminal domain-containing protein [Clostridiaceae bacterium]
MKAKKIKVRNKKGILLLLLFILVSIVARNVNRITLLDRAIVVGMGIEMRDNSYYVHLQVLRATGNAGNEGGSEDSYVVLSGRGETVADALGRIGSDSGLSIALAHCNIIILTDEILDENLPSTLTSLIGTWQLPDQSVLLATYDSPAQFLNAQVPVSNLTAFYMRRALRLLEDDFSAIKLIVKDYLADYYSKSGVTAAAFLEENVMGGPVDADGAGSGQSGQEQGQSQDDSFSRYYMKRSMVFGRDIKPMLICESATAAIGLIKNNIKKGAFNVFDKDVKLECDLVSEHAKCKINEGEAVIDIRIKMRALEVQRADEISTVRDFGCDQTAIVAQKIKVWVEDAFLAAQLEGIDIFQLEDAMYQKKGRKWIKPDGFIEHMKLTANVVVTVGS